MNNDLDTQSCTIDKLRNDPKDSKPDNSSDSIIPSFCDVSKYSVNKDGYSLNTNIAKCNIKYINVSTAITESDDVINEKLSAFIKKTLHNLPKEMTKWPFCFSTSMIESKQSVKISQQELQTMIIKKVAEIMAIKSPYSKQMINVERCKKQQRSYYNKYKKLLNYINSMIDQLTPVKREPSNVIKHVRHVGTNIKPEKIVIVID